MSATALRDEGSERAPRLGGLDAPRLGTWLFVVAEAMLFAGLLSAHVVLREGARGFGGPGEYLDVRAGLVATALLVASSIALGLGRRGGRARSDAGAERGASGERGSRSTSQSSSQLAAQNTAHNNVHSNVRRAAWIALALGAAFLALTAREWLLVIHDGVTPRTSLYWSSFFVLTGVHALHVVLGLCWIAYGIAASSAGRGRALELAATYWHFVDFVWIVLFVVLYLGSAS